MGAEVLIVVDIGTPLRTRENLSSAMAITVQLITILIQRNTQEQLETLTEKDVLIQPQLGEIGSGDFTTGREAIPIGKKAAEKMRTVLERLRVPPELFSAYLERQRRKPASPPVIDYVRIENHSGISDRVIASHLSVKPGDRLDSEALRQDLIRVYGIDAFDRVDYHLEEKDGKKGLRISKGRAVTILPCASPGRRSTVSAPNGAPKRKSAPCPGCFQNFISRSTLP
jgi:NTE family protein